MGENTHIVYYQNWWATMCVQVIKKSSLCRFTVILKYYKYIQQSKLNSEDKITSFYKMLGKALIRGIMLKKRHESLQGTLEFSNKQHFLKVPVFLFVVICEKLHLKQTTAPSPSRDSPLLAQSKALQWDSLSTLWCTIRPVLYYFCKQAWKRSHGILFEPRLDSVAVVVTSKVHHRVVKKSYGKREETAEVVF